MLNTQKTQKIEQIIEAALRSKMKNYAYKSTHKPFHAHLLGKDRMALHSFIQSCYTSFGEGIFELVAAEIARDNFTEVANKYDTGNDFSKKAQSAISDIVNDLTIGKAEPNHAKEVEKIRKHCQSMPSVQKELPLVDVFLSKGNQVFLIDLKTVKPNKGNFKEFKQTLLEWVAAVLYKNPGVDVCTMIAIPYNPDHPEPYSWWTKKDMLEIGEQLKVAEEFWNFLAGADTAYDELLNCFERVGCRMRNEIDAYFKKFSISGNNQ